MMDSPGSRVSSGSREPRMTSLRELTNEFAKLDMKDLYGVFLQAAE